MELRVLPYFFAVAREGDITHAAKLKELEGELGKKLFVRGTYNVRLTDEGMLLRKSAEDILDMEDKTSAVFQALGEVAGGDIHSYPD